MDIEQVLSKAVKIAEALKKIQCEKDKTYKPVSFYFEDSTRIVNEINIPIAEIKKEIVYISCRRLPFQLDRNNHTDVYEACDGNVFIMKRSLDRTTLIITDPF